MANEPDVVLQILRNMDAKLDQLIEGFAAPKTRMTAVEEAIAGTNRRIDRAEARLDRIEKRLDLVEPHH